MATEGTVPTFGLWYGFRQEPSLDDYAEGFERFGEAPGIRAAVKA